MEFAGIRPTTTQRVRELLSAGGADVKPWAPLNDTYAALYELMAAKRDDETFWIEVEKLFGELVEDAAGMNGRLPAPSAEILKAWDIEDLVRDLRKALPNGTAADPAGFKRFSAGLAAPVLGGVLLLGLAASGCVENDDDIGTNENELEWAEGCELDASSSIFTTIKESSELTAGEKAELCGCFASFEPIWRDNLDRLFEECDAEGVAFVLEQMVYACEDGAPSEDPTLEFDDGCDPAAAYKGVSFPR